MNAYLERYTTELKFAIDNLDLVAIKETAETLEDCDRVLVIGNGGSFSTATHIACDFMKNGPGLDVLTIDICAGLLTTGTGMKYTPEYIDTIMTECINRDHELSKKFGVKKEDDTLPHRFVNESLSEGLTKGSTVDISKMVDEYYELHKWE